MVYGRSDTDDTYDDVAESVHPTSMSDLELALSRASLGSFSGTSYFSEQSFLPTLKDTLSDSEKAHTAHKKHPRAVELNDDQSQNSLIGPISTGA